MEPVLVLSLRSGAMASNLIAMASYLIPMSSNLVAMASTLLAMATEADVRPILSKKPRSVVLVGGAFGFAAAEEPEEQHEATVLFSQQSSMSFMA